MAAQAGPDQGRSVSHSPAAPEPAADLFALDAEIDQFARHAVAPPARRGPGRPAGSVNRTTLQLQRLLLQRGYRDPAEFLAALITMDVRELVRDLGGAEQVDVAKVLAIQKQAADSLMPYFHQRMPIAVEHHGDRARPLIIIRDGEGPGARARVVEGEAMSVHDVQNQALSEVEADASHGSHSHDGTNDE
ncbi:hypothetical protein [Bosea sp. (in: a-proteobacteria)]|uniref:hypothetical protein n=1 Tax=Bosea sp. (in: a-proteobacteria) TaxID=1871050 RepID=UPI00260FFB22|nr:hypothetical protein [Bosea sp. (in: a-proteobacteria)]MCO5091985.1 hypothetical protein [Bosea sp. (in: a-proteobacteria)]